mmetsp:Transcript_97625/g.304126  ORF Transcript_97625/g.304126 Transcript_97625/m.304126 type:complete len:461 (+) Transcript_97625:1456-2838(+)
MGQCVVDRLRPGQAHAGRRRWRWHRHCGPWRRRRRRAGPPALEEDPAEASKPNAVRRSGFLWSKTDRLPEKPLSAAELLQEVADIRVTQWLESLRERPRHSGILGFQNRGKMVMRWAVMFEDRIDIWDGALMAASGRKPSDRILLRSIRGSEAVFGGFILNCGGRRIGIHVNSNEELRAWSSAILDVITAAGSLTASSSSASTRSRSIGLSGKQEEPSPGTRRQRAHSAGWVPRVATLGAKPLSSPQRKTFFTTRREGNPFIINTHKAGASVGTTLHGSFAKVMAQGNQPGGRHMTQDVAGKVNEPRTARTLAAENSITEKVTGSSPVCSPRKEPGSLTWLKVHHSEATPPPLTARSRMEPRSPFGAPYAVQKPSAAASPASPTLRRSSSLPVTGKVNEAPWGGADSPSRHSPPSCAGRHTSKITDRGRERSGWAQPDRPASVDKVRGLADGRLVGLSPR